MITSFFLERRMKKSQTKYVIRTNRELEILQCNNFDLNVEFENCNVEKPLKKKLSKGTFPLKAVKVIETTKVIEKYFPF